MPNQNSNKQPFSDLTHLDSLDALEKRLAHLEGVIGALESSQELDARLLRACLGSAAVLVVESQQITSNLCSFV